MRRLVKSLLVMALAGAALIALVTFGHAALDPWSTSITGKPTLTGYWAATVPFGPGPERQVAFHVTFEDGDCFRCVDGDAKICAADYKMDQTFDGHVKNYHGTEFELSTAPYNLVPGVHLGAMTGTWAGGDELKISMEPLVVNADRSSHSDEQPDKPTPFTMHRISKSGFNATCR
ncbi:hypothetical protein HH310_34905 [Actinoplanes sp. TBRC 11911]|uniref:hypothetical protein n=1 Tax=Actinoplanes sp. TBRC 11911 TaxID=2729386 RepID=UPI00145EC70D|nr:hypothetical protein [Actinoplanes sp. TBRC 11911]NMO56354.1 hypothetical protein [Actinoplanes sp. TBRC 11911]